MRVLVCGGRAYPNRLSVFKELDALTEADEDHPLGKVPITVIHGACPTGADRHADDWAVVNWAPVEDYPADWSTGRGAGPARNQKMVDTQPDLVLAFLTPGAENRGTSDTIRRARRAGIPVRVFY